MASLSSKLFLYVLQQEAKITTMLNNSHSFLQIQFNQKSKIIGQFPITVETPITRPPLEKGQVAA